MFDDTLHRLARSQILQSDQADTVILTDEIVVCRIAKGERQQPLFFQVAPMVTGKAAHNHRHTAQQARRQSSVFTAAPLTVIVITDDDPLQTIGFIVPGGLCDGLSALTRDYILPLASLTRKGIDGT